MIIYLKKNSAMIYQIVHILTHEKKLYYFGRYCSFMRFLLKNKFILGCESIYSGKGRKS